MRFLIFIFIDEQNQDLLIAMKILEIFIKVPNVVFTKTLFSAPIIIFSDFKSVLKVSSPLPVSKNWS